MTVREQYENIRKLLPQFRTIIGTSGYGTHGPIEFLTYDENDPDDMQLREEMEFMVDCLNDIYLTLKYLGNDVRAECTLYQKENGRYAYNDPKYGETELVSGSPIEFYHTDEDGHGIWERANVEYFDDYFIVGFRHIDLDGLTIRLR